MSGSGRHVFSCRNGFAPCGCICGHEFHGIGTEVFFCRLDPDHVGPHRDGQTSWFIPAYRSPQETR